MTDKKKDYRKAAVNLVILYQMAIDSDRHMTDTTYQDVCETFRVVFSELSVDFQKAILGVKSTKGFKVWITQYIEEEDVHPALRFMKL